MKISDILEENLIIPDLVGQDKIEIINELVEFLVNAGKIRNKKKIIEALLERERLGSTGLGDNFALPHAKLSESEKIISVFGRSIKGFDFDSVDSKPVYYIFLLISPINAASEHIKALINIYYVFKNTSTKIDLMKTDDRKKIYNIITTESLKHT